MGPAATPANEHAANSGAQSSRGHGHADNCDQRGRENEVTQLGMSRRGPGEQDVAPDARCDQQCARADAACELGSASPRLRAQNSVLIENAQPRNGKTLWQMAVLQVRGRYLDAVHLLSQSRVTNAQRQVAISLATATG